MKMPPLVSQTQNIWFIHTCDVNRPYTFWTVSALKCFPRVCVSACVIIFFEATTRLQFPEPLTYFHSINILPSKCNHPFNLWQAALGEKRGKLAAPLNCIYEILFISSLTSSPKLITVSRLQIECKTVLTLQIWLLFFQHDRHLILLECVESFFLSGASLLPRRRVCGPTSSTGLTVCQTSTDY